MIAQLNKIWRVQACARAITRHSGPGLKSEFCNLKKHASSKYLEITVNLKKENFVTKRFVSYVLIQTILPLLVNCITSVKNVMENITSVFVQLKLQNQTLLIVLIKKIPSKQRQIIFPASKTMIHYKPLGPTTNISGYLH